MNLQQLKNAVEVERTGSITQAAKNLYMGQPNLSKSIKDLEEELGISIFSRSAKGVIPTDSGLQFLRYARKILAELDELKRIYSPNSASELTLNISVPRATYISLAFSEFIADLTKDKTDINVQYHETNSLSAVMHVADGTSELGIIRFQDIYEEHFINLIDDNRLKYEELCSFKMCALMSANHPLAGLSDIPYHMLESCTELCHGDFQVPSVGSGARSTKKRVLIYDRGSQFDLLRNISDSFIWVSPFSFRDLNARGLVLKPCSEAGINKDLLIYRKTAPLSPVASDLAEVFRNAAKSVEKSQRYFEK